MFQWNGFRFFRRLTGFEKITQKKRRLSGKSLGSEKESKEINKVSPLASPWVEIELGGKSRTALHPFWLRHHCQCKVCIHPKTYQRRNTPSILPIGGRCVVDKMDVGRTNFTLTWSDGHKSTFDNEWIQEIAPDFEKTSDFDIDPRKFVTWESDEDIHAGNEVAYEDIVSASAELSSKTTAMLLSQVNHRGYAIVKGAPATEEATKRVCHKIGTIMSTIYGDISTWTSDLSHPDTAYTSEYVHMHTDTSYFTEPIGLQIFHCLEHQGSGGVTMLTDGFSVAKNLLESNRQAYNMFASVNLPFQYLSPENHFLSYAPIFSHLTQGQFLQLNAVRYNPHDLGILSKDIINANVVPHLYQHLTELSDQFEKYTFVLKLNPGTVLIIDNWRMLHGRDQFTGKRTMCGAYISRSDWLSKARIFSIVP